MLDIYFRQHPKGDAEDHRHEKMVKVGGDGPEDHIHGGKAVPGLDAGNILLHVNHLATSDGILPLVMGGQGMVVCQLPAGGGSIYQGRMVVPVVQLGSGGDSFYFNC